ncbi:dynein heavy chain 5, axonemal [Diachasma alloeum]|uniref:dynein heavy chain 5, axonemal n=1 Tax=Diachasma alloeum TaxID=454923 RepID=UPI0007383B63|nr:dynein heavy chain 5, axonemal [Diachasma alloeum]
MPSSGYRDYTPPAIDQRINELLDRRAGAYENLSTETTREQLEKYKGNRALRQGLLKTTHRHVLDIVALMLNTQSNALEEGILDKDEYVQVFSDFFVEEGRRAVLIYYQPMDPPAFDSGRWTVQLARNASFIRCCVTDGSTEKFTGKCVIVYRLNPKIEFATKQLLQETYYAYTEVDELFLSTLHGVFSLMLRLNVPAIQSNPYWGDLIKNAEIERKRKDKFTEDVADFCQYLARIDDDLRRTMRLDECPESLREYSSTEANMNYARNHEAVEEVEEWLRTTMKSIQKALVESQQLQRESEDFGPNFELMYWRQVLVQFSSISEQMKSPETTRLMTLLVVADSNLVKKWKKLEDDVANMEILARDNITYLQSLEKFTEPLYRLRPTEIGEYLPGLMYTIRMIYSTSRFFNSQRMLTAIFVKITNQMILSCKAYLTENGTLDIWRDSKSRLISRMKDCINLYEQYYNICNSEMEKNTDEMVDERLPFKISRISVFGKFDTFKQRLDKKYDYLDHRKLDFNTDYEEFKKSVLQAEEDLRNFISKTLSLATNIDDALVVVLRFQKLNLGRLWIDSKYLKLVPMYESKIEAIRDIYNEGRSSPAIARNIPSVAGRILWVQQLSRFIIWNSLGIPQLCHRIQEVLRDVEIFVKEVNDIKEARVDEIFQRISETAIIKLDDHALSPEQFVADNINFGNAVGVELELKSAAAEKAVITIINKCLSLMASPEVEGDLYDWVDPERMFKLVGSESGNVREQMEAKFADIDVSAPINIGRVQNDCMDVFTHFNNKLTEVLVKCTKRSLEMLKKRYLLCSITLRDTSRNYDEVPLLRTHFILQIPTITISPSIEKLQSSFSEMVRNLLAIHTGVKQWGQRGSHRAEKRDTLGTELLDEEDVKAMKSYYQTITDHKDIVRSTIALQGIILMLKSDIIFIANDYVKAYSYLWAENRNSQTRSFVESEPITEQIKEEFLKYDALREEIRNLPRRHVIGCIEIDMENLKGALQVEVDSWKNTFNSILNEAYKQKINQFTNFMKDKSEILERKINDLEDVRIAMKCLNEIRENFIALDITLVNIEETFAIMANFNVPIAKEDQDAVDGLRYSFNNMQQMAKAVQTMICQMQEPLKQQLMDGVQVMKTNVEQFDYNFEINGPMVEGIPAKEASERLILAQARFDELWERYETYSSGEALFGIEITQYPALEHRKKELNLLQKLYGLYLQVMRSIDGYYDIQWRGIDLESIASELVEFQNKCRKLPRAMYEWPAYIDLKQKIDDFNEICPLLTLMANKAMKPHHWERLSKLCNHFFDVESENFTLAHVIQAPLLQYKEDIEDICISAVKEKDIDSKLKQVIADWAIVDLHFANFKQRGELLLKGTETGQIISQLEDSLMIISSLLANRYNTLYKKEIQSWQDKLSNTAEILARWLLVQNLWAYLEAVFIGGDIAKQLPGEAKRFSIIDKAWVKLMHRARDKMNAVDTCTSDETMSQLLPHLLEQLESCQKSLSGYLETKRVAFPRFYFVSDPNLLEILGQAADCHSIQHYLDEFFDNVAKVDFSETENDKIIAIYSHENEKVVLDKEVACVGGVEIWLNALLKMHQQSVGSVISQGLQLLDSPENDVFALIDDTILQTGLLAIQTLWTRDSEVAILTAKRDRTIMKKTNQWFLDLLNGLIEITVKDLTKYSRAKYEADIFDDLCKLKIRSIEDFEWLKQARFYYDDETEAVVIKITNIDFIYQNEFLGCTDRLAVTPLTDRCYITLAQAIGMNFGGAPAGPAGTGKTETTKDMGKCLGKYVVVFNCSDQMDFRGLGRIFKGLAQAGAWGCFDEFNRIDLPVLSVAAQQIAIVLTARKEKRSTFLFSDGQTYPIDMEFGLFITMNPGYAGRQELPENLKIQFRSIAMMVPDRQIIMRVKLAACGFKENILLARKFFTLYKLCEEQLSKQVHYDFGLRNILSCLRTLGAQKRAHPEESEETTLMRVLRDMNLSKLVDEDEPLFLSLIEDMFPGMKLSSQMSKDLQRGISNAVEALGIINHPEWNLKVVQLYETSLVRHGLMVLGPTGSGKTCCMWSLLKAMTEMGMPHKEVRMNPKAITAPQMFGRLDVATNDWTDGIFSTLWRRSTQMKKGNHLWIVLDGPVDAVWIENLNSVLDDNKTLTLANGDRIVMSPSSKLVFEPDNVDNASPATVSRMGMVFVSASVLKWPQILEGWLKTRLDHEKTFFRSLFHKIYGEAYEYLRTKLEVKMVLPEVVYIRQCRDLLVGLLQHDESNTFTDRHLERFFLFSMMWSLGAVLELDGRASLQDFLINHPSKCDWPILREDDTIFEYLIADNGNWIHWSKMVPIFNYPSEYVLDYHKILVPNIDNTRTMFLIDLIAQQEKAVLLIGEQGTAKTVMLKSFMSHYNSEIHLKKSFNFSSASTPNMVQRVIESYVDKRVGTTYGPPGGRKMTVFIDDINMPEINEWGDQITNELIRQLMECKGFYSLDKPGDFNTIQDMQFLAAMIHPGGGRNDIPPRLKRQFNIFNCTLPSAKSMDTIFGSIGEGYFCESRFSPEIVDFLPKLVPLTRTIWQQTKAKLLPTPSKFHYVFNLRDLSRIWEGILRIESAECTSRNILLKLWDHECTRVIADRFTIATDKEWFKNTLKSTTKILLAEDSKYYDGTETYFANFLREAPEPTGLEPEDFVIEEPKIYEPIHGYEFVVSKVYEKMEQFNECIRGIKLDLVFFHDALVHLLRISRILGMPRGNALLVGVGGSGKQSSLLEDLKKLYSKAVTGKSGITFIFSDNEIKEESFLEYLNNVLSVGEIANLFPKGELDEILLSLISSMRTNDPKTPPTQDNLYDYFISQARNNLHVALCFSPVGGKFRSRALKFPGLISGCTINWFSKWPMDALCAVSKHFLGNYQLVTTQEIKNGLIEVMADIHDDVRNVCVEYYDRFRRQTYVTAKSFLSFLDGYKAIYRQRLDNINMLSSRMTNGLHKLIDAAEQVDGLRKVLERNQEDIAVKNVQVEAILERVDEKKREAEAVKAEVQKSKDEAETLLKFISKDKANAEEQLKVAEPALLAAEAALQTIKAADISTIRKLGKPPYLITLIMDCVLILFGRKLNSVKPDYDRQFLMPSWSESLKFMADTRFLYHLQNFPKDNINAETVDLMRPYAQYELYNYEAAKQACGNVAGLLQWTLSMAAFYEINKDVLPLKANLAVQQSKYDKANHNLREAEEILKQKDEDLRVVQSEYDGVMAERQEIVDLADACQAKMDTASALIGGLSGERIRWTNQLTIFRSEIERLVGDAVILTAFLFYCGPFNQEFRSLLQKHWFDFIQGRKIPFSVDVNIPDALSDVATISEWNLQGLPNDELSTQNAIIVTKAARYPLLIDPQLQGKAWIKNKESQFGLQITNLSHKYFRNHLEDSVSIGNPLLIEDVMEELDPILDNLLDKNFLKIGTSLKVLLGDKEVDVNKDFRLYITTKFPNPSYTPEIFARSSIIDFSVTMKGLEDQLLSRVILAEKRELETGRTKLVTDITVNKRKIQELEANLLHKLTTVQGSLLDDVELMAVLTTTQKTAAEVTLKLNQARDTEIKVNIAREEFRSVATRGSVLYFLICDMSKVNCMYQTSLVQFLERFDLSLIRSEKSPVIARRINAIIEELTLEIYRYTARGLYENHKFMFLLLMTLKIDLQRRSISHEEFDYFIKGGAGLDLSVVRPKQCKWITDKTWLNLAALASLRQFQYILSLIEASEKVWKNWYDKEAPEEEIIPDGFNNLDSFRRLLFIRAWCMDRTLSQARKYIIDSLGPNYADPVITILDTMYTESRSTTPMICFLSMGTDPTPSIVQLAKKMEIPCKSISMGQSQEVHARKLMGTAENEGFWVLCQNCHLSIDYMNELVSFIQENQPSHPNFRIWMTTESHLLFPISLLQMSIKFTYEPPQGVRAGLLATYSNMNQEMLDQCDARQYIPLVYAISFLHTVVQERRKFGALGWNIPYEFNSTDWLATCMFINNHLNYSDLKRGLSWQTIRYMIGEVQYGGRVTDDYDKRLLNTFTKVWFADTLFNEDFVFYKGYTVLSFKNVAEYLSAIDSMPSVDPPQIYGLHRNADITYQSRIIQDVLDTVISIQPKGSTGTVGETREGNVLRQAKEMLDKLPLPFDPFYIKARLQTMGITESMTIFLKQEMDRMQILLKIVRLTLQNLLLAIEGVIIMNEDLRDTLDNIYDARIPRIWRSRSWDSSTLGFWVTELLERNQQFSKWITISRPDSFWMTGFFNPQGFLTAMRQEVTRAHKGWALDNVTLYNEVTRHMFEEIKSPPNEGVYVHGLFLEGGGWERRSNRLRESLNKILHVEMPVIHISAVSGKATKDTKLLYECPVYKKPMRTYATFIVSLMLQTNRPPEFWVIRGVALLCDNK